MLHRLTQYSADIRLMTVQKTADAKGRIGAEMGDHLPRRLGVDLRFRSLFSQPRYDGNSIMAVDQEGIMSIADYTGELAFKYSVEEVNHPIFVDFPIPEAYLPSLREALNRGPIEVRATAQGQFCSAPVLPTTKRSSGQASR